MILPSVEGCHHGVGVHLLGQLMRLPGDRDPFQVDARAAVRSLAELHQVAGQPVREVDHRRGAEFFFGQRGDHVAAGAGFQVFFEQVFVAGELRFGIFDVVQDALLAFEQLETHIGGARFPVMQIRSLGLAPLR